MCIILLPRWPNCPLSSMTASGTTSVLPGPPGTGSGKPTRTAPRAEVGRTWLPTTPSSPKACWCWARSRCWPWGQREGAPQNQRAGRLGGLGSGDQEGASCRGRWSPARQGERVTQQCGWRPARGDRQTHGQLRRGVAASGTAVELPLALEGRSCLRRRVIYFLGGVRLPSGVWDGTGSSRVPGLLLPWGSCCWQSDIEFLD